MLGKNHINLQLPWTWTKRLLPVVSNGCETWSHPEPPPPKKEPQISANKLYNEICEQTLNALSEKMKPFLKGNFMNYAMLKQLTGD